MKRVSILTGLAVLLTTALSAQESGKKALEVGQSATVTATVEAIDPANRVLTLKVPGGNLVDVSVSPAVKRFPEIKVGDRLTVTYTEALVVGVSKAEASAALGSSVEQGVAPTPGQKPEGVISRRIRATVAVESVDAKQQVVTVRTAEGKTRSFHVRDPKNLEGVKAGDRVTITYDEAIAISVKAPQPGS